MKINEWAKNGKPKNVILLGDCMDLMSHFKDNEIQLAITDPPYGIGEDGAKNRRGKSKHTKKEWDNKPPNQNYFNELFRISKNQIIWGSNYFIDKIKTPSMGWICWDKKLDNSDFSDFELSWTSFNRAAKIFRFSKNGGSRTPAALADIIHPTQKPIQLYRWLLQNYAKPGQLILDTHSGSGSLACACHLEKFDFIAIEKDIDYHRDSVKRLEELRAQGTLF